MLRPMTLQLLKKTQIKPFRNDRYDGVCIPLTSTLAFLDSSPHLHSYSPSSSCEMDVNCKQHRCLYIPTIQSSNLRPFLYHLKSTTNLLVGSLYRKGPALKRSSVDIHVKWIDWITCFLCHNPRYAIIIRDGN